MYKKKRIANEQLEFKVEVGSVLLLIVSVFAGVWYSFYIEEKDTQTFRVLYTWLSQDASNIDMIGFSYLVLKSMKKLLFIWLCGWLSFTSPLGWILLFIIIFSYSFTTTTIILLFGGNGIFVVLFAYGLQAILCVSIGLILLKRSVLLLWGESGKKVYSKMLIPIVSISVIVALLDVIAMNNLQTIIK